MEGRIVYMSDVPAARDASPFDSVPEVQSVRDVAALLGVSARTVRREIGRGRLGCFRVGTAVRVTKEQLLRYIEEASN